MAQIGATKTIRNHFPFSELATGKSSGREGCRLSPTFYRRTTLEPTPYKIVYTTMQRERWGAPPMCGVTPSSTRNEEYDRRGPLKSATTAAGIKTRRHRSSGIHGSHVVPNRTPRATMWHVERHSAIFGLEGITDRRKRRAYVTSFDDHSSKMRKHVTLR